MKLFLDPIYLLRGRFIRKQPNTYAFAFLVHSRGYRDIYRKYPILKFVPKGLVIFFMNRLWPITLSRVTGVHSLKDKTKVRGYVLGITMTAEYMMSHREEALRKIRQALYLARGKGAKIVGLGGLTSSLSGGGIALLDIDVSITTGHAYTAYNVTQNLFKLTNIFNLDKSKIKVAVVGAAGSVGSLSSLILARAGYKNMLLIDLGRKSRNLDELESEIKKICLDVVVDKSNNVNDIRGYDFVVTATNTPEALVTTDKVSSGMIIIDDAQPSDIHRDVLKMEDVLVIEAGVVHTPGIHSNFNYGLKSKTDNFCCMAELLILASHQWEDHYVVNRATLENVDIISEMGKELGFEVAAFQNFQESIKDSKIEHMKILFQKKYNV